MTLTLEFPPELESQIETAARQRGTDAQTVVIEATRAGIGVTNGTRPASGNTETRDERRARIHAAIDAAQADFAHLSGPPFGDAVSELMASKRADVKREIERGL